MPTWLYTAGPQGLWVFLLVTVVLGGLAAVATGRALAQTWRPWWQLLLAMLPLTLAVRFVHFSVFQGVLISGRNLAVDLAVLTTIAVAAYADTRRRQMADQYGWLERR